MNMPTHQPPSRTFTLLLAFALLSSQLATAQTPTQQPPPANPPIAPVPSQIASAHNIFLVNGASDPNAPIPPDQAYNQVYSAFQTWGHYQLVSTPAQADLILSLREISPITGVGGGDRSPAYAINSPAFQLTFTDAKTNVAIWTITSPVYLAGRGKIRAYWTSVALTNLVSRVKVLANQPLSPDESADLTNFPKNHNARTGLIVIGALVVVGLGGGLLLHHEFENSLADQKASADKFCMANNIPLSECAGG